MGTVLTFLLFFFLIAGISALAFTVYSVMFFHGFGKGLSAVVAFFVLVISWFVAKSGPGPLVQFLERF